MLHKIEKIILKYFLADEVIASLLVLTNSTMVSSLSSRLLAGRGDSASRGSSKDSGSPNHKNIMTGSTKTKRTNNENSMSGYSADREGPSPHPPVVSINLHSKSKASTRVDALKCPKRRKKNEMQFAATTVKADLARAGKDFKTLQKYMEHSSILASQKIKLKDHVKLVFSKDASKLLVPPSNIGKQTTTMDYTSLISAVNGFYPCKPAQMSDIKSFERNLPSGQNTWSEPSTSSVSDTLSDYGSDNTNNQASGLTPLLEDSLDPRTKKETEKEPDNVTVDSTDNISPISNPISMTSILQLSKTARYDKIHVFLGSKNANYISSVISQNYPFPNAFLSRYINVRPLKHQNFDKFVCSLFYCSRKCSFSPSIREECKRYSNWEVLFLLTRS